MAPRPTWKGYLKLSLVSCPVALYTATSTSQRIRFNIINRKTGHRVHNQVVDAETEKPVEQEDRVKGYQISKGEYVLVEDEELDADRLVDVAGLLADPARHAAMSAAARDLARPGAAGAVADLVLAIAHRESLPTVAEIEAVTRRGGA